VRILEDKIEVAHGPMTISSIGSIPEPIPGIPQRGEVYTYVNEKVGLLMDGPTAVFAAGNVLTGKGNIKDSLESGTEVGTRVAEAYLGLSGEELPLAEKVRAEAHSEGEEIADAMDSRPTLELAAIEGIIKRVRERQRAVGFGGNFREWIAKVTPPDLQ
jgi:hypothetical protein